MKNEIPTGRLLEYLKCELTKEEAGEIEKWASESEENERTLISLAKIYHLGQFAKPYSAEEVSDAWDRTCAKAGVRTPLSSLPVKKHRWVVWPMAAAIVILVVLNVFFATGVFTSPASEEKIMLTSLQGGFVRYVLPDSSVITLNRNSTLEFPVAFNGRERRVRLDGEGFFEVVRDESRPFIVETEKDIRIKVLGTTFNLQSYSSDDIVQVSLISGSVEVSRVADGGFRYVMHPSEQFTCNVSDWEMSVDIMHGFNGAEWMYNRLVFVDTALKEAARRIANHFGVKVSIADEKLETVRFSGSFEGRGLETVLSYIEQSCGIEASSTADGVVFSKK